MAIATNNGGVFDFSNFNWDDVLAEIGALTGVVAQITVASPAVVNSPTNTAPSIKSVQQTVQEVVASIAPIMAPNVPPVLITKAVVPEVTQTIVKSPEVKATPSGVAVPPAAVANITVAAANNIATGISDNFGWSLPAYVKEQIPAKVIVPLDEQTKAAAAEAAKTAAASAGIPTAAGAGAITDSQNAARLAAEQEATAKSLGGAKTDSQNAARLAAEAKAAKIANDPDVIAAKKLQAEAQAEVDATKKSIAEAKANLATITPAPVPTPTPPPGTTLTPDGTVVPKTFKDAFGNVKNLDPDFVRNPAAEARAIASGNATAEQIEARGGINASGYYGDSYGINSADGVSLTDEEYADALRGKTGAGSGAAINAALAAKIEMVTGKKPAWLGSAIASAEENKVDWTGPTVEESNVIFADLPKEQQDAIGAIGEQGTVVGPGTSVGTVTGTGASTVITPSATTSTATVTETGLTAEEKKAAQERQSIITILTDRFNKYGLGSLAAKIRDLAVDGASEATITIGLQETEEYKTRFAANTDRLNKGLKVLTPGEYLNLEDGYRQVLRSYGLKQFDTDAYVKQFIANDVSAAELSDRVVTAVQRVQNADPAISQTLRDYYGIGAADMVAYVLDPNQQLQKIQRQVSAAEVGTAARRQGLEAGVAVSEQLAAQGISEAEAQKGYATIANILPTAEKLSKIYGGTMQKYGQTEGEQEVFNSLASAQRAREKLTAREIAQFQGSSGTMKTSLSTATKGQLY